MARKRRERVCYRIEIPQPPRYDGKGNLIVWRYFEEREIEPEPEPAPERVHRGVQMDLL